MDTNYIPHSLIKEIYPHMIADNYVIMIRTTNMGDYYTKLSMETNASGINGTFIKR